MKTCPYCEQADLWVIEIADIDGHAVMCRECDTVWWREQVVDGRGMTFGNFMEAKGLPKDWNRIDWISKFEG